MRLRAVTPFVLAAGLLAQAELPRAQAPQGPPPGQTPQPAGAGRMTNPYASSYQPFPSGTTVIRNATILTAAGPVIERGAVLIENGKITAVGQTVNAPA